MSYIYCLMIFTAVAFLLWMLHEAYLGLCDFFRPRNRRHEPWQIGFKTNPPQEQP